MKFFYNDVNLVRAKPRASLVEAAARTEEAGLGFLAAGLGLVVLGLGLVPSDSSRRRVYRAYPRIYAAY